MKKLFAILMTLMLVVSMNAVAFAESVDMSTVTITKNYDATNTGTTSPAETFNFSISNFAVSDAAAEVTVENMPTPTIDSVTYGVGDAGSANKSKDILVTLPSATDYKSVGIYKYNINETAGSSAGVTYYANTIRLVVTVEQTEAGFLRVAAVHTEDGFGGTLSGGTKKDEFANTYSAGTLAISKTVTGNMGDQSKAFDVTVTFIAPEGKKVNEAIGYTDDTTAKNIATTAWKDGKATANITLKHGETVTFTNIPYGVTYTVEEADYTGVNGGYDVATYTFGDENKKIDTASDTVTITNNKGVDVDTGITTDSLPYVLLIALVAVSGVLMVLKRRNAYND